MNHTPRSREEIVKHISEAGEGFDGTVVTAINTNAIIELLLDQRDLLQEIRDAVLCVPRDEDGTPVTEEELDKALEQIEPEKDPLISEAKHSMNNRRAMGI